MQKLFGNLVVILLFIILAGCVSRQSRIHAPASVLRAPIDIEREFRATWVCTVVNIDWPSTNNLTVEEQKNEAVTILDSLSALNINAVIFQVRPQCDAIYKSKYEPWSYYLTGIQGVAPNPFYDPLKFWLKEAHMRGIELHAWFNPYRAHHPKGGPVSKHSIINTKPHLVHKLKSEYYWLDPGSKETQDLSFNVIMDVLKRYDVDGIHFDDYFYPYSIGGDFPDSVSWNNYLQSGGTLSRNDWRRDNVNRFILRVSKAIKREKPHVKFGISPFGIWRPNHPKSIKGMDQYNMLYADARLWFNKGWVDYFTPQLYWPINRIPQSYPVLLGWWAKENKMQRHLWPGLYSSRVKDQMGTDENFNQIMISRAFVPEAPGQVHFSVKALLDSSNGLAAMLKKGPYAKQALVPATPWLDDLPPSVPQVKMAVSHDSLNLSVSHADKTDVAQWILYYKYNTVWEYKILNCSDEAYTLPLTVKNIEKDSALTVKNLQEIAVSAVDRLGNESSPVYKAIE